VGNQTLIVIFDFETFRWSKFVRKVVPKFYCMQAYQKDKKIKEIFSKKLDVVENLENIKSQFNITKSLKVYAHNLNFDIKFVFDELEKKNYKIKPIGGSKVHAFKIYKNKKLHFDFRDSMSLLPMSLKRLGKALGFKKLEFNNYNGKITEEYKRYCFRDCEVVFKGLQTITTLFKNFGLSGLSIESLPLTLPSLSYKLFKEKNCEFEKRDCKNRKINKLLDIPERVNTYFRNFYFGGRTDVFNFNKLSDFVYFDVNSLYPSILINNAYPIPPYTQCSAKKSFYEIFKKYKKRIFAIECIVKENRPIPRFVAKVEGKNCYRNGKKRVLLTMQEYEVATVVEIKSLWLCKKFKKIFLYLKDIYKKRLEYKAKHNSLQTLMKLPLNSTYGKFAERCERKEEKLVYEKDIKNEFSKYENWDYYHEKRLYRFYKEEKKDLQINVVFAWFTTNLARFTLYNYIELFTKHGFEVYYTDTDSVVVQNQNRYPREIELSLSETKLGGLKREFSGKDFQAFSLKEYVYFKKGSFVRKCKGVGNDILNYYKKGSQKTRPSKYRECLTRKKGFDACITMVKHKTTHFDRRKILSNGTTQPLEEFEVPSQTHDTNKNFIEKRFREYTKNFKTKKHLRQVKLEEYAVCCFTSSERIERKKEFDEAHADMILIQDCVKTDKKIFKGILKRLRESLSSVYPPIHQYL